MSIKPTMKDLAYKIERSWSAAATLRPGLIVT